MRISNRLLFKCSEKSKMSDTVSDNVMIFIASHYKHTILNLHLFLCSVVKPPPKPAKSSRDKSPAKPAGQRAVSPPNGPRGGSSSSSSSNQV